MDFAEARPVNQAGLTTPPIRKGETPAVYEAIVRVMRDLSSKGISKEEVNQQQGYNFRSIDAVYNALSARLATHALCIIPRVTERTVVEHQSKSGGTLCYVVVKVDFDLVCAIDGSIHTASFFGEAMDSGDKATNKAMSAAYKYMAMEVFCIPTEGMDDADASSPEPARSAAPKPTHKPSSPPPKAQSPNPGSQSGSTPTTTGAYMALSTPRTGISKKAGPRWENMSWPARVHSLGAAARLTTRESIWTWAIDRVGHPLDWTDPKTGEVRTSLNALTDEEGQRLCHELRELAAMIRTEERR